MQDTCPGLVDQIESGKIDHPDTREILKKALDPMLAEGVDEVVMGCTHYPFVIPIIKDIVGEKVRVIDPAPAVARQTGRILDDYDLKTTGELTPLLTFLTTGDPGIMEGMLKSLLDLDCEVGKLIWKGECSKKNNSLF